MNAENRIIRVGIGYSLDEYNQFKSDLMEIGLDMLLDQYYTRRERYNEYKSHGKYIHWTEDNEEQARLLVEAVEDEIRRRLTRDSSHNRMYSYIIEDKTPIVGVVAAKSKEEAIKLLCGKYTVVGKGPLMPDSHRIKIEEIKCEGVWQITPDE